MNIPGFTADVSLHKTRGRYLSVATRVDGRRDNQVISQVSRTQAEHIQQTVGFGKVVCATKEVCIGWYTYTFPPRCAAYEVIEECGWQPYS